MSATVPIDSPLLGLNTRDPFVPFESRYARELTNIALVNGAAQMRPAVVSLMAHPNFANTRIVWADPANSNLAVSLAGNEINLSTGVTGAALSSYSVLYTPSRVKHVSLNLLIGLGTPRQVNSPFAIWSITTSVVSAINIRCACSHKGRLYVCDGATIEYSDIGQIAGAMPAGQTFPISRFMQGEGVIRMFSITALPGNYTSNVFVIFGSAGRVLVYQGDYPGSPSWELIGDFKMPEPINEACFVEINGDIFIGTNTYAYWFRDLFTAGAQTAFDNRPSINIDNLWQSVTWRLSFSDFNTFPETSHFFYLPFYNCIICQCFEAGNVRNRTGNYNNEACFFVYSLEYKAWSLWLTTPFFSPVIYNDNNTPRGFGYSGGTTFFSSGSEIDTDLSGNNKPIITSWKTPYYSPQSGKNRLLSGVKPFFLNESGGVIAILRAIFDFSDYNNIPFAFYSSPYAGIVTEPGYFTNGSIIVNQQTSNIYTEFAGLGGNGAAFSIQFTQIGTTNTLLIARQTIYKASALLTEGANYPA